MYERSRFLRQSSRALGLIIGLLSAGAVTAQEAREPGLSNSLLRIIAPLSVEEPVGFFIAEPGSAAGTRNSDAELCRWALEDWVRHAGERIQIEAAPEAEARIRVYFVSAQSGRYGEMRPVLVDGRRGAEVFVRPDTGALGSDIAAAAERDPLLRETIVYLTCLHEIGHALGMEHTAEYADVMYSFGYGGDIPAFFGRYRSRLESRDDIAFQSGLSEGDIAQLRAAYATD